MTFLEKARAAGAEIVGSIATGCPSAHGLESIEESGAFCGGHTCEECYAREYKDPETSQPKRDGYQADVVLVDEMHTAAIQYRPCMVTVYRRNNPPAEQRALFHKWTTEAEPIPPSLMRGGQQGGQFCTTLAIVELEDGKVTKATPDSIRFIDTVRLMSEIAWETGEDE